MGRKPKLVFLYWEYAVLFMYLWPVYYTFTDIEIINEDKYYTVDL